jgi:NADH/F420H2 dehydrogenase subunit C
MSDRSHAPDPFAPADAWPVPENAPALVVLREACAGAIQRVTNQFNDLAITLDRSVAVRACTALRDDPRTRFDFCMDVCGVDWLESRETRFDVVLHLYSTAHNHRVRVIFPVPEEDPTIATLIGVWKATNWFEREVYDMFGIQFTGHPWLKRILCHDDFVGFPLRKDYDATLRHPYAGDTELPQALFDAIPGPRGGGR